MVVVEEGRTDPVILVCLLGSPGPLAVGIKVPVRRHGVRKSRPIGFGRRVKLFRATTRLDDAFANIPEVLHRACCVAVVSIVLDCQTNTSSSLWF
jgi:hypothetical protein